MKRKTLPLIIEICITICIGIFLLFIGIIDLLPDFIINKEGQLAIGFSLTAGGLVSLFLQIFKIKNEKIPFIIGIFTGISFMIVGFFLMWRNLILAIGVFIFLSNLIFLLRIKKPNQEFFNKKPYNQEK